MYAYACACVCVCVVCICFVPLGACVCTCAHAMQDVWRGWELNVSSVAYFWFAFAACMPVWLVVPALLSARAWRRLDAALARAAVYREGVRASPDFATYKTR